jgi:hypothetical protein
MVSAVWMSLGQTAVGDNERARPDYSDEAGWVAGRAAGSASWAQGRGHCGGDGQADASAGGHGRKVVAVEPVAGMRERLAAALTGVEPLDGVAEAIPLDDAAVHAATVGQAFHWFDGDRALIEIIASFVWAAGLAVVYNRRRSSIRFRERSRRSFAHSAVKPAHRSGRWRDAFARSRLWTAVKEVELPHVQLLDREGIVARVAPTSFIAELPAAAARTSSIKSEHLSKDARSRSSCLPSASSSSGSTFPSPAMKREPNSDFTTGRSAPRWLFQ